jgi:hypothetical protein
MFMSIPSFVFSRMEKKSRRRERKGIEEEEGAEKGRGERA